MCTRPISIINPHYKKLARDTEVASSGEVRASALLPSFMDQPNYRIQVPCGHCLECLRKRRQNWVIRAHHLFRRSNLRPDQCLFCTFSISPDNYERALKDPYAVWRRFIDRLRKHPRFIKGYNKKGKPVYHKVKFHYLAVVEFGDGTRAKQRGKSTTYRMHFHAVFFGLPLYWWQVRNVWRKHEGFAWVEPLRSFAGVNYVTKYIFKDHEAFQTNDGIDRSSNGKLFVSHGFGRLSDKDKRLMKKMMQNSREAWFWVSLNGFNYSVPRYWKTSIFTDVERKFINEMYVPPLLWRIVRAKNKDLDEYHQLEQLYFLLNYSRTYYGYDVFNAEAATALKCELEQIDRDYFGTW